MNRIIEWTKYKNFSEAEFKCPCCGRSDMREDFIAQLQESRLWAGIPFKINSGFRCERHNHEIGGELGSAHLRGFAADIAAINSRQREKILCSLFRAGFNRIGIADTFIHADCDPDLPIDVVWIYPKK